MLSIISSISSCESCRIGGLSKQPCDEVAIQRCLAFKQNKWREEINAQKHGGWVPLAFQTFLFGHRDYEQR